MTFFSNLFAGDDACNDAVLAAADAAAKHPEEWGRAVITVAGSPLGLGAVARAESGLEAARAMNDWVGGVADIPDVNREIGAWAGPPLAGLAASGACHVQNAIDGWGATPAPSGVEPVANPAGAHDWAAWGTMTGDGFGSTGPSQGSAFDPPSSTWAVPSPTMEPSFVDMGPPSSSGTSLAFDPGQAPGWSAPATVADWQNYLSEPSNGGGHVAVDSSSGASSSGASSAGSAAHDSGSSGQGGSSGSGGI